MSDTTMRAISVRHDLGIELIETPAPSPADDEIVLMPLAAGICGTDLHIVKGEFPQAVFPVIPLHEFAGRVVAVGRNVRGFREGDLATADPNIACGACRWCRASRPNLCERLAVTGVTRPGAAAERVAVPARCAHLLPTGLTPAQGAMVEPLACACNALTRAGSLKDKRVLVLGSGIMGLLITLAGRRDRPAEIWVSDPAPAKHPVARGVGADRVVQPSDLAGERFDVVFEAAGVPAAAQQVMELLNPMGVWMQVGVLAPDARVALSPFLVFEREISIIGSNSLADKFPMALELMPDIAKQADTLITNKVSVWDFDAALASARGPRSVKTQVTFDI